MFQAPPTTQQQPQSPVVQPLAAPVQPQPQPAVPNGAGVVPGGDLGAAIGAVLRNHGANDFAFNVQVRM